ncbi:heterokaryon incompatibility protein-domain-containing protein [Plectosphaerella plurivora]|uniref:Heterokaryon incompatibility protein-domain-containing protein n=1 Tax=Plectosphaerella plurivora TaxID=936078 RepID=A0A9P8VMC4_9PEZI|nr:heterokaryon incompatibility protein-domain-containing protein [Plectosphaerella plurivora]
MTDCPRPVLENIPADDIPNHPYAILSHTWGLDEVVFTDVANGTARAKPAFAKVAFTCRQAARDGLEYAWIDSCCIDKASSAELSEAINSMFPWYRAAVCCYALLEDYHHETLVPSALSRCRWFTRGWTLQELLAPSTVTFHAASGTCIGTRESLCRHIADITRIDADILTGELPLGAASVAKRMSWAANRQTTRLEDTAYCLLGIFDVNMPMLYGEGARAFVRLQEEIMKTTDDESLFACTSGF